MHGGVCGVGCLDTRVVETWWHEAGGLVARASLACGNGEDARSIGP